MTPSPTTMPPSSRQPRWLQTLTHFVAPRATLDRNRRKHGDVYIRRNLVFGDQVVISDPELIKEVFSGSAEDFRAGEAAKVVRVFLGDRSVVVLDGDEHRRMRKTIMPSFQGRHLEAYADTMCGVTARSLAQWPVGEPFTLQDRMQQLTLDIILQAVMGLTEEEGLGRFRRQLTKFINRVQSPTGALWLIAPLRKDLGRFSAWAAIRDLLEETDNMLLEYIRHRRSLAEQGQRGDLLQILLLPNEDSGRAMDDASVLHQLKTLLLAGHETTATSMCWAFEEVLRSSEIRKRLEDEIWDVTDGRALEARHLPQLEYVDATVKEVLRLHPVVDSVARVLTKPLEAGGYRLPAGTIVSPSIYLTHHRSDLYADPRRFRPERFIGRRMKSNAWLPFGGGVRRCLGMAFAMSEMKIVLASVLARTRLQLTSPLRPRAVPRALLVSPKGGTQVVDHRVRGGRSQELRTS